MHELGLATTVAICLWTLSSMFKANGDPLDAPLWTSALLLSWLLPAGIADTYHTTEGLWLYIALCHFLFQRFYAYAAKNKGTYEKQQAGQSAPPNGLNIALAITCLAISVAARQGTQSADEYGGATGLTALLYGATRIATCTAILYFCSYGQTGKRAWLWLALVALSGEAFYGLVGFRRETLFTVAVVPVLAILLFRSKAHTGLKFATKAALLLSATLSIDASTIRSRLITDSVPEAILSGIEVGIPPNMERAHHEYQHLKMDFVAFSTKSNQELGTGYWNELVHAWYPGFILGASSKKSLMAETHQKQIVDDQLLSLQQLSPGATRTGFSDSFVQFSWLGSLVFGMWGWLMGRWKARAWLSPADATIYLTCLPLTLTFYTHSTGMPIRYMPWLFITLAITKHISRRAPKQGTELDLARSTLTHGRWPRALENYPLQVNRRSELSGPRDGSQ